MRGVVLESGRCQIRWCIRRLVELAEKQSVFFFFSRTSFSLFARDNVWIPTAVATMLRLAQRNNAKTKLQHFEDRPVGHSELNVSTARPQIIKVFTDNQTISPASHIHTASSSVTNSHNASINYQTAVG